MLWHPKHVGSFAVNKYLHSVTSVGFLFPQRVKLLSFKDLFLLSYIEYGDANSSGQCVVTFGWDNSGHKFEMFVRFVTWQICHLKIRRLICCFHFPSRKMMSAITHCFYLWHPPHSGSRSDLRGNRDGWQKNKIGCSGVAKILGDRQTDRQMLIQNFLLVGGLLSLSLYKIYI